MPRVQTRVARKDYPQNGIKKGGTYYYTKLKLQRGGIVKRSLRPFKRSELTTSDYLGQLYDWEDAKFALASMGDAQSLADTIGELGEAQQEKFDNMPDGLQQGDTGQQIEARASACEQAKSEIEDAISEWESARDTWENEIADYKTAREARKASQEAFDEWESRSEEEDFDEPEPTVEAEPDVPDNTVDGNADDEDLAFDETEWLEAVQNVEVSE